MSKLLSVEHLPYVADVRRQAQTLGVRVYLVGGVVRDLWLDRPPGDLDFTVEGEAPALARAVARALGGAVTVHAAFRTAAWTTPTGAVVDFTTARREVYPQPAALPVVTPAPLPVDLQRRDFTINALALPLDSPGELIDRHGGQADLTARMVRVLHPGSFVDDPTRLFRAVRYEQRLGFALAPETRALIPGAWAALAALTADRLWHEFELIFGEANAPAMLARLAELDILAQVHPALRWEAAGAPRAALVPGLPLTDWRLPSALVRAAAYLALLLRGAAPEARTQALARLNVKPDLAAAVQAAFEFELAGARPSEITAQLDRLSALTVAAAYVLYDVWRPSLDNYLSRWRFVRAETTGADLMARGLPPGPAFKQLLGRLRAARLDGAAPDVAAERALLDQWLSKRA